MPDLGKFRDARVLRWNRWTVFTPATALTAPCTPMTTLTDFPRYLRPGGSPERGLDADLVAPADRPSQRRPRTPRRLVGTVIGVIADPTDLRGLHETLRAWRRDVLGRDDIQFTVRVPDGTFETVELTACEDF